jgi:hypothetical protein
MVDAVGQFCASFSGEHFGSPVSKLRRANEMRSQTDHVAKAT